MSKLFQKSLLTSPAVVGAALAMSGAALAAESPDVVETNVDAFDLTESLTIADTTDVAVDEASVGLVSAPEADITMASGSNSVDSFALASQSSSVDMLAMASGATSVDALAQINDYSSDVTQLAQVTRVSELSDVQPSDWAFQALRRLVEEYGCIEGYPNRTFRGNRAMTRYEFAAGLNACLDVVLQLIGSSNSPQDLSTVRRLQEEFQAELSTLRGRVDALEADVTELEANQFSTTTKLSGEVTAHLNAPIDSAFAGENPTFEYRARLNFDTSFTGEDRLRLRLQSGNNNDAAVGFPGGLADTANEGNDIVLNDAYYAFPVGDRLDIIVAGNSIVTDDFVTSTIVPFDGVSVGEAGKPLFYDFEMGGGSGIGGSYAITDNLVIDAGYSVASNAISNPEGQGIFGGGGQSYIAQLSYLSDNLINAGFAYLHGNEDPGSEATNTFAGLVNLDFGRFEVGGYAALHDQVGSSEESFSWQAGVSMPDLFVEGNTFGVYVGQAPSYEEDEPFFAEAYYEMELNEFLSITPAILYAEENTINSANVESSSVYGTIRAVFKF
ncbi:MAG: iron uptake porin [Leptolyngbyaceae cyanobacterium MO_188.B28]|nr:iron uptake porin [Leptolyngbyaceae cyanobacterium MO_188.B28]